jgi:hypothetical protein
MRTLLTHQQPPPTFLQARDAPTLEELTQGHHTPASTTPSSSTSRALVAAPPPSSTSPPASLFGAPPLGPSGGGGRGATEAAEDAMVGVVGVVGRPHKLRPVVRAYLHVAPLGTGRGASSPAPAGGHGHECCLLRADLDSTSSAQLIVDGGWDQAPLV